MPGPPKTSRLGTLCLAALCCGWPGAATAQAESPLSMARLRHAVERLGGDAFEGRGTGQPGGAAAARYLASRLGEIGLEPMGRDGSYLQPVPMHGGTPLPQCRLEIHGDGPPVRLDLGADYLLCQTGAGTFVPTPVPLVFAGYGIVAPEYDYNDYQGIDVRGAVVVFLAGEPPSDDPAYFAGPSLTRYALPALKQRIALSRGARGSVLLTDDDWERLQRQYALEDVTLPYDAASAFDILLRPGSADALFAGAPHTLAEVRRQARTHSLRSFPLKTRLRFFGAFFEREFVAHNVLGALAGTDGMLRDEYVLLSAHYDHLGVGPPVAGDSLYNGVVDNALGCAALLEIAAAMAADPQGPRRSVLFLFVTGEEKGLLGSRHYCSHPAVPLHRTAAAVNVDGLSIIDTFDDIMGVGAELSELGEILAEVGRRRGLRLSPIPAAVGRHEAFSSSDQLAFARAGIPSIVVLGGFAYRHLDRAAGFRSFVNWGRTRYHTPFDDLEQPINYAAVMQHGGVLYDLARHLADRTLPPAWKADAPYLNARLRSLAENR